MTPTEHDTVLLELLIAQATAQHRLDNARSILRSYSDTMPYSERNPSRFSGLPKIPDTRTDEEVLSIARSPEGHVDSYTALYKLPNAVERYDGAFNTAVLAERAVAAHEANYNGWQRFWLVTSSPGHVHSSTYCSSCKWTTTYALVPTLSDSTEAEAVAMFGPAMCTVCFPSAPTGLKVSKALAESVGTDSFDKNLAKHQAKLTKETS